MLYEKNVKRVVYCLVTKTDKHTPPFLDVKHNNERWKRDEYFFEGNQCQ